VRGHFVWNQQELVSLKSLLITLSEIDYENVRLAFLQSQLSF
jgi:hypothetical protein